MCEADAIVIGAPLYFRAPPSGFHTVVERIQSMAFFHETIGDATSPSPLAGVPCGLVAVAEYSNPHGILEYLHDFVTLMQMRPIQLGAFPYLGVGAHGDPAADEIFRPFDRAAELGRSLVEAVQSWDRG
jgi:multimeric flavodoxin WrbA